MEAIYYWFLVAFSVFALAGLLILSVSIIASLIAKKKYTKLIKSLEQPSSTVKEEYVVRLSDTAPLQRYYAPAAADLF
jgi:hypothetical protein